MYIHGIDNTNDPLVLRSSLYEKINSFEIVFCPYCGAMNYVKLDGSIRSLMFCNRCGGEL